MSDMTTAGASGPPAALEPYQRRVLGVLIEKQKTSKSADAYPMTLNSIVLGCNQKSNRDPVYELDEDIVEETLQELQKLGLVMKMTGGRAERFRHLLYEQWKVTKVEMAILAELLMRGSQTEGDLRTRASRMEDIQDLEELRGLLQSLVARHYVIYLTEPNRRGTIVTHGFYAANELEVERKKCAGMVIDSQSARPSVPASSQLQELENRLNQTIQDMALLKEAILRLEQKIDTRLA